MEIIKNTALALFFATVPQLVQGTASWLDLGVFFGALFVLMLVLQLRVYRGGDPIQFVTDFGVAMIGLGYQVSGQWGFLLICWGVQLIVAYVIYQRFIK